MPCPGQTSSFSRILEKSVFCHYHHAHQQSEEKEEVGEASHVGAGKADLCQHLGCLTFLMMASVAYSYLGASLSFIRA